MTKLSDKIQDALDESRMLVLGAEILVGFEFTATFQDRFEKLSVSAKNANSVALTLMLVVLVLLLAPCAFHQLVVEGEDRANLHRFTTRIMDAALLPFALGLGVTVYIPAEEVAGVSIGVGLALSAICLAGIFWYGLGLWCRSKEIEENEIGFGSRRSNIPPRQDSPSSDRGTRHHSGKPGSTRVSIRRYSAAGIHKFATLGQMDAPCQSVADHPEHHPADDPRRLPPDRRAWRRDRSFLSSDPGYGSGLSSASCSWHMWRFWGSAVQGKQRFRTVHYRGRKHAVFIFGYVVRVHVVAEDQAERSETGARMAIENEHEAGYTQLRGVDAQVLRNRRRSGSPVQTPANAERALSVFPRNLL